MRRTGFLTAVFLVGSLTPVAARSPSPARAVATTAFPLAVSADRRHLVDQKGRPFFVMGDTPWFIQKAPIEGVRHVMDDRKRKGYNTLFLAFLDDLRLPSRDAHGNLSFDPETDITKPVEAYWRHADQVMDEAERRGFFVIMSELWYGAGRGMWLHHVNPENARVYGRFLGKRYARFKNLMWMHAGDHNPDNDNLLASTRALAMAIRAEAPHHLHTVHNQAEFASAAFHHADPWLDANLGYTYGAAHPHTLPEYQRKDPVRPFILGETGYEDEPNHIERLPDAKKGDLWTPYLIRRNAWWAVLTGASGFCNGTRVCHWEKNWRELLDVASARQTPLILKLFEKLPWWRLVPDTKHAFVTAGFGEWKKADHVAAALASDGSVGVVYLPSARPLTVDLSKLRGRPTARWFDPTNGASKPASEMGAPAARQGPRDLTPPGKNAAGEADWVLVVESGRAGRAGLRP